MENSTKKITPAIEAEVIESKEIVAVENQIVKNDADIDGFIEQRRAFITKVNSICVEGKDFHIIQGKKSLAKGGAEKIASIFHWTARFDKDTESLEMLGAKEGLVAFKCTLQNGQVVGEGRGAATLQKNGGDPNKTLKMAQKSAFIDAVLRASGLSDFFTQDLEDMPAEQVDWKDRATQNPYGATNPYSKPVQRPNDIKPSEKQLKLIADLMHQKGYTKEDILDQGFTKLTGGKGGTASELIDFLFKAKSKVTPNDEDIPRDLTTTEEDDLFYGKKRHMYENGKLKEGLPVIQQEMTDARFSEEEQKAIDEIPF